MYSLLSKQTPLQVDWPAAQDGAAEEVEVVMLPLALALALIDVVLCAAAKAARAVTRRKRMLGERGSWNRAICVLRIDFVKEWQGEVCGRERLVADGRRSKRPTAINVYVTICLCVAVLFDERSRPCQVGT